MEYPLISIIMSVYNDEDKLSYAIASILNQTYTNFEFIICDDCSSDGSYERLLNFEKMDSRIKLIKNKMNLGLASSLNHCLQYVNGEFVARMDSDDICSINRLEIELNYLSKHPEVHVVGTNCNFIDIDYRIIGKYTLPEDFTLRQAIKKNRVAHPTILARKEVFCAVNGYTVSKVTKRLEDYDLWCKILENGFKIYNIQSYSYNYLEDLRNIRKRRYNYRIDEFKLRVYWTNRAKSPFQDYFFCFKPLIVGMVPAKIINIIRRRQYGA